MTSRSGPVGVGVIGAGVISDTYLQNLTSFPDTVVHAVGDIFPDAARARAHQHGVPLAGDVSTVLDHPDIEIVVNLTVPAAHADVANQAIAAGKSVWNEKPLALDLADAQGLLEHAQAADLRVGCAPDTFLGSGLQTAFGLVEGGQIGNPLTALVLLQQPGPDLWHPNPAFLFQTGAGPMYDLGPYYLTALVQVFGPAVLVAATGSSSRTTRTVATGPRAGEEFEVTVPTHVSATIQFASGQSATLVLSFESPIRRTVLEVTGTEGAMVFPDPNMFDGAIAVQSATDEQPVVIAEPAALSSRGTGVLDMARAIRAGQPHRAQGELAYHVLEIMTRIDQAISSSAYVPVISTVTPAAPLPADWDPTTRTL
jgi:predicted dehydrogenase